MTWDWTPADRAALERFLERSGIGAGPVTTRRIGDGHSNLTFLVTGPDTRLVVRRPPPPPVPPGAHDVLREARIMAGIHGRGVPVPDVLAVAEAGEVIDSPLSAMSHVDGPVVTACTPDPLATPAQRRAVGESLVDTLAALHAIDHRAAGVAATSGSTTRSMRRMHRLLGDGPAPPGFDDIAAWLVARVPAESGIAIVHNDFRLGNVVVAPEPPGRVAAVLDWELATTGDPLCDVGYLLATWPDPATPANPVAAMGTAVLEPGWPDPDELADRYAHATGRDLSDLRWYRVLALWKLAALFEYNHRRAAAGNGDPYYADPELVGSFLEDARRTAGR